MATEIYVDGSADNCKKKAPSYTAVWVPGRKVMIQKCNASTNNEAEYMAVFAGIVRARVMCLGDQVTIVSDSQLVVNQLNLDWDIKEPRLRELWRKTTAEAWADKAQRFSYRWCPREVNQAGIELEKYLKREKAHA